MRNSDEKNKILNATYLFQVDNLYKNTFWCPLHIKAVVPTHNAFAIVLTALQVLHLNILFKRYAQY
jgi:hypothetical protein